MAIGFFASIEICYSPFNRLTQGFIYIHVHPHPAQIRTSRATSCLDVRGFPPIARLQSVFRRPAAEKQWGFGGFFFHLGLLLLLVLLVLLVLLLLLASNYY